MTTRMVLSNIASSGCRSQCSWPRAPRSPARFASMNPERCTRIGGRCYSCAWCSPCASHGNRCSSCPGHDEDAVGGQRRAGAGAAIASGARSVTWPTGDLVLVVLAAGIAAAALWLAIGAYGLRRLRRTASLVDPLPDGIRQAQERIGARATLYVSDRVSGPITFGLRRAAIVFPPSVSAMPADVQEAIAYHEFLHVHRRDWLHEILEETVRSVLWFHPAIWWLIGRIRLAREQVVDQSVIRLTDSKERYIEALLAVAVPARARHSHRHRRFCGDTS